jgi:hypothetical protein
MRHDGMNVALQQNVAYTIQNPIKTNYGKQLT